MRIFGLQAFTVKGGGVIRFQHSRINVMLARNAKMRCNTRIYALAHAGIAGLCFYRWLTNLRDSVRFAGTHLPVIASLQQ